jgi:hypothetical protein
MMKNDDGEFRWREFWYVAAIVIVSVGFIAVVVLTGGSPHP